MESKNVDINNLIRNIFQNDLYKQIYNKFFYLPLKNNIQIILKYYPNYECQNNNPTCMTNINDIYSDKKYIVEEVDKNNNKYYYRNLTHLDEMLIDNYINSINIDNITVFNKNIIPSINWMNYVICPTLDPVHNNHLLIIHKNSRSHQFYFPSSELNIMRDMLTYNRTTGYYIYNSIELGSIPEKTHLHTTTESPPIDRITEMNHTNIPLFVNEYIKLYKFHNVHYKSYYIELADISNDEILIDKFTSILAQILYSSRFDENYKYMGQFHICSYNGLFFRINIVFRRVELQYSTPINGVYDEKYYSQLFGNKRTMFWKNNWTQRHIKICRKWICSYYNQL